MRNAVHQKREHRVCEAHKRKDPVNTEARKASEEGWRQQTPALTLCTGAALGLADADLNNVTQLRVTAQDEARETCGVGQARTKYSP